MNSKKASASLHRFHQRAEAGEPLSVVFLGGSLTWGANASDPQTTSYRGLMMRYLRSKYPKTSFAFHDASIGGTGSNLGLFRLDRDVLSHHPDLALLDFTVNDNAEGTDVQKLAAYERVLRELVSAGTAVLQLLMCFKQHVLSPELPLPPRHRDHLKIAEAYHCPSANILEAVRHAVAEGNADPREMWSVGNDETHPDDAGYKLFFEAVREAFEKNIRLEQANHLPEKSVFPDLYPKRQRRILVESPLPTGWESAKTYRTALWFDGLSSRWMGDVAVASSRHGTKPAPLILKFHGSLVGLFGEQNSISLPFRVWIDDQPILAPLEKSGIDHSWKINTSQLVAPQPHSGNLFSWALLADDLADGEHTLRIEPIFSGTHPEAELRIESVCSAGR